MKEELYFSVDVESSGPTPGHYSLLSLGACVVGSPEISFYAEFKPTTEHFVPDALRVSGFDMEKLKDTGRDAMVGMVEFGNWIRNTAGDRRPVFVGFNGCYDWQFVNWYFSNFDLENPFGFGGIDIKSYYMGLRGVKWGQSSSSQLPEEFQPKTPQTHNALEDARAQASIFEQLLNAKRP